MPPEPDACANDRHELPPKSEPGLWRGFDSAELEELYWRHHRAGDITQAKAFVWAAIAGFAVFAVSDYHLFGTGAQLAWLLAARAFAILFCVVALLRLSNQPTRAGLRWTVLIWSLVVAAIGAYINLTRPFEYSGHAIVSLTFVFAGYLLLPTTWFVQAIPGMLISAAYIIAGYWILAPRSQLTYTAMAISFILANVLGWIWAIQLEYWKRRQFLTLQKETDLRVRLEQALAEIKTLEGILSICSHCKSIRDDAGVWRPVDRYVADHTDAEFSHGICPTCMQTHYAEYMP